MSYITLLPSTFPSLTPTILSFAPSPVVSSLFFKWAKLTHTSGFLTLLFPVSGTLSLTTRNLFAHFIHDFAQKSSLNTHLTCYTVPFYLALYFFIVAFTLYSYFLIGLSVFSLRIWTSGKLGINSLVITLSPMLRPESSTKDAQQMVVEFINDWHLWLKLHW